MSSDTAHPAPNEVKKEEGPSGDAVDDKEMEAVLAFLRKKGLRGTESLLQQELKSGTTAAAPSSTPSANSSSATGSTSGKTKKHLFVKMSRCF